MPNRLAHETSPYLLQHKDNPVDWYPWGSEAFELARSTDRPILLSVGYSACHWCHVMEHESFADPETAALMNQEFVSIKVDREERPDVDALYMQAVQQISGHGGWPMTVFLTPGREPFYGGTYYPPEPRHGLPSFRQVLLSIRDAYRNRRSEVDQSANALVGVLSQGMNMLLPPEEVTWERAEQAYQRLASRFEPGFGGFGGAPKFPQPMLLEFLLGYWRRSNDEKALSMVVDTLEHMWRGGLFDHLGGGFHRYAVDNRWLVPHFEKMLYDNAQLAALYAHAYQATGNDTFREVSQRTLDYLLRDLRGAHGGFFSSEDADSEGEEGKFYVWSLSEIQETLDPEAAALVASTYEVSAAGNWEGSSIPNRITGEGAPTPLAGDSESLTAARETLLAHRNRRVRPGRDEKVLLSWNAMAIRAFAVAGWVFDRNDYVQAAVQAAEFVFDNLLADGRLHRSWRDGDVRIPAFLEDHATLSSALVDLYTATGDLRWVERAREVTAWMLERFWDDDKGIFFDSASDAEALVVRPRDIYDNATPSGNSAAVESLIRLARLVGEPDWERIAARTLSSLGKAAVEVPQGFGKLLSAMLIHLSAPTEVVVVGHAESADREAMLDSVRGYYLPHTTVAWSEPVSGSAPLALLADRTLVDGRATGYVCRHFTCKQPVTEPAALELDLSLISGEPQLP